MKLRILDSALEDLDRGRRFYEALGEGAGKYFLDNLIAEIDSLLLHAGTHRKVFGYHRLLARKFPCGIYYRIEGGRLVVVCRVLDLRRSPSLIQKALE